MNRPLIRAKIDPSARTQIMLKEALFKLKNTDEQARYKISLDFIDKLLKMIEAVCSDPNNDLITRTFKACDKAWIDFAQKCGTIHNGYKPTGRWFRELVAQNAVLDDETITDNLRVNFKNLGWSGTPEEYYDPKPRDEKETILNIPFERRVA